MWKASSGAGMLPIECPENSASRQRRGSERDDSPPVSAWKHSAPGRRSSASVSSTARAAGFCASASPSPSAARRVPAATASAVLMTDPIAASVPAGSLRAAGQPANAATASVVHSTNRSAVSVQTSPHAAPGSRRAAMEPAVPPTRTAVSVWHSLPVARLAGRAVTAPAVRRRRNAVSMASAAPTARNPRRAQTDRSSAKDGAVPAVAATGSPVARQTKPVAMGASAVVQVSPVQEVSVWLQGAAMGSNVLPNRPAFPIRRAEALSARLSAAADRAAIASSKDPSAATLR